jgi:hypothetical protein
VNLAPARQEIESDWALWLATLFPADVALPFADFHIDFWEAMWAVRSGHRPRSRIECWFRGAGKTSHQELATVALAARGWARYGLWVERTQDLADDKVANIADRLESSLFGVFYPEHADRRVGKYGQSRGWRRNRVTTRGGFTLDAAGLDRAIRGVKQAEVRPNLIVIGDIDQPSDTTLLIERHETKLSRGILPARSPGALVIYAQNLVHEAGVMARLLDRRADYLGEATRVGPIPAVVDLAYERRGRRYVVTEGQASWPEGFPLEAIEAELSAGAGPTAFLAEYQHQIADATGPVFGHLDFDAVRLSKVPTLDLIIVRIDPAVEGDADSAQGVACGGIARDGRIVVLSGYEGRCGPQEAVRIGIRAALAHGADEVGIETVQGGRVWESAWREAIMAEGKEARRLRFVPGKPGTRVSKTARVAEMLPDLETGALRIAQGTHHVIEAALKRFPAKPNDLADAVHAVWNYLRKGDMNAQATVPSGRLPE